MPSPCRAYTHARAHIPWRFSWQILTNVLLVSVGVSFELNLYTSAPELTSIGLNSFNSHDICLLAYLLSKQAQAQLASWETLTLAFVSVREENVIACAKYKLKKNVQPWNTHRDGLNECASSTVRCIICWEFCSLRLYTTTVLFKSSNLHVIEVLTFLFNYSHIYTSSSIFWGSKVIGQANIILNARNVFSSWIKMICSQCLPKV